jgi:pimeloyl-ACP methyl ester carboxylesterase
MPFAKGSGGARIHYQVHGSSSSHQKVVLLHGLGLSSRFWFDQPARLSSGPDPWQVIAVDNRGVGRSDRPFGPYTMGVMADDVAAVLEHARIDRAYVVGISLGGMIAQHVAMRHPERVDGLVLLGTSAGFPHMRLPRARSLMSFLTLPFDGRLKQKKVHRSFARLLLGRGDVHRSAELLAGWPAALQTDPTPTRVFISHLAAAVFSHSAGQKGLQRVSCPTVIVTGDDDALLPHHNSHTLARLVPRAYLEVIPGAGHIIHASHPEAVRRALDRAKSMMVSARPGRPSALGVS